MRFKQNITVPMILRITKFLAKSFYFQFTISQVSEFIWTKEIWIYSEFIFVFEMHWHWKEEGGHHGDEATLCKEPNSPPTVWMEEPRFELECPASTDYSTDLIRPQVFIAQGF